jgi:hypothetical protein
MKHSTFSKLPHFLLALLVCCLSAGSSWAQKGDAAVTPLSYDAKITYPGYGALRVGIDQDFFARIKIEAHEEDVVKVELLNTDLEFWHEYDRKGSMLRLGGHPGIEDVGYHEIRISVYDRSLDKMLYASLGLTIMDNCGNNSRYKDADGDGYGALDEEPWFIACTSLEGFVSNNKDCNDENASIHPGAEEIPNDGIDNNCNGKIDETADSDPPVITFSGHQEGNFYEIGKEYSITISAEDPDGDALSLSLELSESSKEAFTNADFQPALPTSGQGSVSTILRFTATEENSGYYSMWFKAMDEAGSLVEKKLEITIGQLARFNMPADPIHLTVGQDLDINIPIIDNGDAIAAWANSATLPIVSNQNTFLLGLSLYEFEAKSLREEHIGTHEILLYIDDIGGRVVDTLQVVVEANCTLKSWYPDADGDGYGNRWEVYRITSCNPITGYVDNNLDCDDTNAAVYPGVGDCPAAENQAPTITFTRLDTNYEAGREDNFHIGQEAILQIHVNDPDGDAVTLRWSEDYEKLFQNATFSPSLPYTATAPYTVELRWTPTMEESATSFGSLFTATDAHGEETREYLHGSVIFIAEFVAPKEPIRIAVGEYFEIPIAFADNGDWQEAYASSPTYNFFEFSDAQTWEAGRTTEEGARIWYLVAKPYAADYYPTEENIGEHTFRASLREALEYNPYIHYTVIVDPTCSNQAWYYDADGDGYGAGEPRAYSCTQPSNEFVANNLDCDDSDASVYPGAGGCEGAENQAPTLSISGLQENDTYEVGTEHTLTIVVADADGDAITLDAESPFDAFFAQAVSFTPSLPVSGEGTLTVEAKIFLPKDAALNEDLFFWLHATDAAGNTTTEEVNIRFSDPNRFVLPADTIRIGVNQPFMIGIEIPDRSDLQSVWGDDLPFGMLEGEPNLYYWSEEGPSEAHIGIHEVELGIRFHNGASTTTQLVVIVEAGCTNQSLYPDRDGDGFGRDVDMYGFKQIVCSSLEGYVANNTDCDDSDAAVYPGTADCAGDCSDPQAWYADADGDGYGNPQEMITSCTQPDGYVANSDDCDDSDATVYPGAAEIPGDGKDNNCDGQVDEGDEAITCWADQNLKLEAICSEVASQHTWMVYNPNSCAVEVKWEVHKTSYTGSMIAQPGENHFTTPTGAKNNDVVFIHWQDTKGTWQKKGMASSSAHCGKQAKDGGKGKNSRLGEESEGISLYPVPFRQQLTVAHEGILSGAPASVVLIGLDGRRLDVSAQVVEQGDGYLQLNLQEVKLANGLYILRLEVAGQQPVYKRVLRQD